MNNCAYYYVFNSPLTGKQKYYYFFNINQKVINKMLLTVRLPYTGIQSEAITVRHTVYIFSNQTNRKRHSALSFYPSLLSSHHLLTMHNMPWNPPAEFHSMDNKVYDIFNLPSRLSGHTNTSLQTVNFSLNRLNSLSNHYKSLLYPIKALPTT